MSLTEQREEDESLIKVLEEYMDSGSASLIARDDDSVASLARAHSNHYNDG